MNWNTYQTGKKLLLDIDAHKRFSKDTWKKGIYGDNRFTFIIDTLIFTTRQLIGFKNLCELLADYLQDKDAEVYLNKIATISLDLEQILEYLGINTEYKLITTKLIDKSDHLSPAEVAAKLKNLAESLDTLMTEGSAYVESLAKNNTFYKLAEAIALHGSRKGNQ